MWIFCEDILSFMLQFKIYGLGDCWIVADYFKNISGNGDSLPATENCGKGKLQLRRTTGISIDITFAHKSLTWLIVNELMYDKAVLTEIF